MIILAEDMVEVFEGIVDVLKDLMWWKEEAADDNIIIGNNQFKIN